MSNSSASAARGADSDDHGGAKGVPYFDAAQTVQAVEEEERRQSEARFDTGFYTKNLERARRQQRLRVLGIALAAALGAVLWGAFAQPPTPLPAARVEVSGAPAGAVAGAEEAARPARAH